MTSRNFARKRARILASGRSEKTKRKAIMHAAREAGAMPIMRGDDIAGWRLPDGFHICQWRRFPTDRAAWNELQGVNAFRHLHPHALPTGFFLCHKCKGFHLSASH